MTVSEMRELAFESTFREDDIVGHSPLVYQYGIMLR